MKNKIDFEIDDKLIWYENSSIDNYNFCIYKGLSLIDNNCLCLMLSGDEKGFMLSIPYLELKLFVIK